MAGSKENPPMTIMGDYPIKVLGYKFGNSFYLLPTLYKRIYMQYIIKAHLRAQRQTSVGDL